MIIDRSDLTTERFTGIDGDPEVFTSQIASISTARQDNIEGFIAETSKLLGVDLAGERDAIDFSSQVCSLIVNHFTSELIFEKNTGDEVFNFVKSYGYYFGREDLSQLVALAFTAREVAAGSTNPLFVDQLNLSKEGQKSFVELLERGSFTTLSKERKNLNSVKEISIDFTEVDEVIEGAIKALKLANFENISHARSFPELESTIREEANRLRGEFIVPSLFSESSGRMNEFEASKKISRFLEECTEDQREILLHKIGELSNQLNEYNKDLQIAFDSAVKTVKIDLQKVVENSEFQLGGRFNTITDLYIQLAISPLLFYPPQTVTHTCPSKNEVYYFDPNKDSITDIFSREEPIQFLSSTQNLNTLCNSLSVGIKRRDGYNDLLSKEPRSLDEMLNTYKVIFDIRELHPNEIEPLVRHFLTSCEGVDLVAREDHQFDSKKDQIINQLQHIDRADDHSGICRVIPQFAHLWSDIINKVCSENGFQSSVLECTRYKVGLPDHVRDPKDGLDSRIMASGYLVIASHAEQELLGTLYDPTNSRDDRITSWEKEDSEVTYAIGMVGQDIVLLNLSWVIINNQRIMFADAASNVVDKKMIENWLKENAPLKTPRRESWAKADSSEFSRVISYIDSKEK